MVADFSGTPTSGIVPLTVDFTDLTLGEPDTWDWDFGDGSPHDTAQNPSHVYSTVGTYTVTLDASNSETSDSETKTDYIVVSPVPPPPPSVDISGTLILDGNLTAESDIVVEQSGLVIPVPDEAYMGALYSCESKTYITPSGISRIIESVGGDIAVLGLIDGNGQGFPNQKGPGCNSVLIDNFGELLDGYGATHAGLGAIETDPDTLTIYVEEITLTSEDITAGKIELLAIPTSPTVVVLNVIGGGPQYYPEDYEILGTYLSWNGKSLDGRLAAGDQLRIIYEGRRPQFAPAPKPIYGSYEAPMSLGSGSFATYGGGGIKLEAPVGTITIGGTITVNGQDGDSSTAETGGGSGGSIWAVGWNLDGTGSLFAKGGNGNYSGGGGGGYISLWYEHHYTFDGIYSVDGTGGSQNGIFYSKKIEPFFEEKFTGQIWNTKWWETLEEPVTLNNYVRFDSSQGIDQRPAIQSLFSISGKNIQVDADYIPLTGDINAYGAYFLLCVDDYNWVGVARKQGHYCGVYCVDGIRGQSALAADNSAVTFRISKTDATFSLQYYDCTHAPYTICTPVFNEFNTERFKIRMGLEKNISGLMTEYFLLNVTDIANQYITLSGEPTDATAVTLNLIGGGPQYYGTDFYVSGQYLKWDDASAEPFRNLLETGDVLRVIYETDVTSNEVSVGFDYFRVFDGIMFDTQTTEPVIYVDSIHGSDTCSGQQFYPLENLFVATAWAPRGGTVVLYDGTYNPTEITRKDLTVRGADGATAVITSANVQDTTGSGWETNAISVNRCQGRIHNLTLMDSAVGVLGQNTKNLEVFGCQIYDVTTGVQVDSLSWSPVVRNTLIHTAEIGIDFSSAYDPYVESCIIYDTTTAVRDLDSTNLIVTSSTLDNNVTGVLFDNSSTGIVASSNITNSTDGIDISTDSSPVYSYNNNFYGTPTVYPDREPDGIGQNISSNPLYVGAPDYHLSAGSPDINAGTDLYDEFMTAYDLKNRSLIDGSNAIGAYEYLSGSHDGSNWYVAGAGDDYVNFGGITDPFRTLDKAMSLADALIEVDGGHYDTYYLALRSQSIYLNRITVVNTQQDMAVSYITLDEPDIRKGRVTVPGYYPIDGTNVLVNPISGPTQIYEVDFTCGTQAIMWKGLGMDGIVGTGDVLRVIHPYRLRPGDTITLHPHYSNVDISRMVFVSPNGSDTTTVTGDGTEGWGNGTREHPWRTIDKALADASSGDYVVALSGEYPLFSGLLGRILLPIEDRTSIDLGKRYFEDLFAPIDFRSWNHVESDTVEWDSTYTIDSSVSIANGYMSFVYDGSDTARADSRFSFAREFDLTFELRSAVDPVFFEMHSHDETVFLKQFDSSWTAGVTTGGDTYSCWGAINVPEEQSFYTEYLCITSDDTRRGYAPLSFLVRDCTSAVNIIGGPAQTLGVDYTLEGEKLVWRGLGMDGELIPGDLVRVMYKPVELSDPLRVRFNLTGNRLTVSAYDYQDWTIFKKQNIIGDGTWSCSFYMDRTGTERVSTCQMGRAFVSKFLAIADEFYNTDLDRPYGYMTRRKPIILTDQT